MFDIDKLTNDLVSYVQSGVLTQEHAEAVYEAACRRYNLDPETGEEITESTEIDDIDMTLEEAFDALDIDEEITEADINAFTDTVKAKAKEVGDSAKKTAVEAKGAAEKKINELTKKDTDDEEEKASEADIKKALAIGAVATAALAGAGAVALTQTDKGRAKIAKTYSNRISKLRKDFHDGKISKEDYRKKAAPMAAKCKKLNTEHGFLTRLSLAAKAGVSAAQKTPEAQKVANRKNDKELDSLMKKFELGKIDQDQLSDGLKKIHARAKKAGIKTGADSGYTYNAESAMDLINDFLYDRIMEACSECDPAKNVEDEIDEKLPTVTPNESDMPADDPEMEKTDKRIEDAKKYLTVANKLAEMKSAHEAEKDTTEQHEVIKQALESTMLDVYEAFEAGYIDDDEKAYLLDMLDI